MRLTVLFTLALFGLGTFTMDASAFGKRKKKGSQCGASAAPASACCGSSSYGSPGAYGAAPGVAMPTR